MSSAPHSVAALNIRSVTYPAQCQPVEQTAAEELARFAGVTAAAGNRPGRGVSVALASRRWVRIPGTPATGAWIWLRVTDDGAGEIIASEPAFLFAAVRLLAHGLSDATRARLDRGVLLKTAFNWHRTASDSCLTQYWRSARKFDPEQYVATLAENGFTHVEVNGLDAHLPFEDTVASEYYPQFYTYGPGFNHFIDTPLTRGIWPAHYL